MDEYMNIDQKIEHYQSVTGIYEKPDYMNKDQYLDYLVGKSMVEDKPKKVSLFSKIKGKSHE